MKQGWRRWLWFDQTAAEQAAYRQALGLFFGALLGAQLGLLDGLPLRDFVIAVMFLVVAVMAFQLMGQARSRRFALTQLAIVAVILAGMYLRRAAFFPGIDPDRIERLFATMGVWVLALLFIELTPTRDDAVRQENDR